MEHLGVDLVKYAEPSKNVFGAFMRVLFVYLVRLQGGNKHLQSRREPATET